MLTINDGSKIGQGQETNIKKADILFKVYSSKGKLLELVDLWQIETMVFDDAYNCRDGYECNNDDIKYPKMLEVHTIIMVGNSSM